MKIGLDYDGTITADPELWMTFIRACHHRGHEVHIVTMRHATPNEAIRADFHHAVAGRVHYTGHEFKFQHMTKKGIAIQVWIDDAPGMITGGGDVLHWD